MLKQGLDLVKHPGIRRNFTGLRTPSEMVAVSSEVKGGFKAQEGGKGGTGRDLMANLSLPVQNGHRIQPIAHMLYK